MLKQTIVGLACLVCVGGGLWLGALAKDTPNVVQEKREPAKQKEKSSSVLMRKKLAAAQDILEGLTTEDFEMIEQGAKLLKSLAAEADFQISKDAMYVQHSNEFQNLADKLEKAAKGKSIDKASLHYVNLTMNCIECHRFVRDVLVAQ